jgi:hypothetical protein
MSVLLKGGIYEVCRLDSLEWHKGHTNFHDDPFWHLSKIKAITPKNWEPAMLVLLTRGFYEISCLDGLKWHDIHIKFHDNRFEQSSNIN